VASGFDVNLLAPRAKGDVLTATCVEVSQGRPHRRLRHRGQQPEGPAHRGLPRPLLHDQGQAGRGRLPAQDKEQAMPVKHPEPGDLEPIETASRDELPRCSCSACKHTLQHAYDNVPHYRRRLRRRRRAPRRTAASRWPTWRSSRSPPRPTCARTTPSACSPCRASRWCACTPRPAPPASPRWWATRSATSTPGPTWWRARSAPRRPRRRHRARGLRLRPVHRRPGRALRRRAAGLHRGADGRRADREAGAADHGLPPRHHHGHAQLHAGDRRGVRAPGQGPAGDVAQRRHLRRRALDRGDAPRHRAARRHRRGRHLRPERGDGPGRGQRMHRDQGRPGDLGRPLLPRDHRPRDRRGAARRRAKANWSSPR
jgi:hypothetical protein